MKRTTGEIHAKNKQFAKRFKVAKPSIPQGGVPYHKRKEELKNFDFEAVQPVTFSQTTANANVINVIDNGTAFNQHVGREILMKSLYVRWNMQMAATSTNSSSLRLLVVYDRQTNTALPATTQIVQTDEIVGMMNLNNNKRFSVLLDEVIPCLGTGGPQAAYVSRYVKLNHLVEFNQTNGGTVADIQTGSVIALFWQEGNLGVASPVGSAYFRIRFLDA